MSEEKEMNFITDEEAQILLMNLAETRGEKGFTKEEGHELLIQIQVTRFYFHSINLALKGLVGLDINENSLVVIKR